MTAVRCAGPCGDVEQLADVDERRPDPELLCRLCSELGVQVTAAERAAQGQAHAGPLNAARLLAALDLPGAPGLAEQAGRWLDQRPNARTDALRAAITAKRPPRRP